MELKSIERRKEKILEFFFLVWIFFNKDNLKICLYEIRYYNRDNCRLDMIRV